jgi:hypothetical protein
MSGQNETLLKLSQTCTLKLHPSLPLLDDHHRWRDFTAVRWRAVAMREAPP